MPSTGHAANSRSSDLATRAVGGRSGCFTGRGSAVDGRAFRKSAVDPIRRRRTGLAGCGGAERVGPERFRPLAAAGPSRGIGIASRGAAADGQRPRAGRSARPLGNGRSAAAASFDLAVRTGAHGVALELRTYAAPSVGSPSRGPERTPLATGGEADHATRTDRHLLRVLDRAAGGAGASFLRGGGRPVAAVRDDGPGDADAQAGNRRPVADARCRQLRGLAGQGPDCHDGLRRHGFADPHHAARRRATRPRSHWPIRCRRSAAGC